MDSSYPKNLNYRDFFMYLIHPTFTYQDHYPVRPADQRSWKTVFFRLGLIFLCIVSDIPMFKNFRTGSMR
jgi:hypothetical protein